MKIHLPFSISRKTRAVESSLSTPHATHYEPRLLFTFDDSIQKLDYTSEWFTLGYESAARDIGEIFTCKELRAYEENGLWIRIINVLISLFFIIIIIVINIKIFFQHTKLFGFGNTRNLLSFIFPAKGIRQYFAFVFFYIIHATWI